MFCVAQIFGLVALIILSLSFQKDNKNDLLKYQIFSSLFFSLQYLFLHAVTGFLVNIVAIIRNIVFRKHKQVSVTVLFIVILMFIVISVFSYKDIFSLLPTSAAIMYSIAIWQKNLTITRLVEVLNCLLFIIYNIKVMAIAALISTIIELVSAVIAIIKFDIKKEIIN